MLVQMVMEDLVKYKDIVKRLTSCIDNVRIPTHLHSEP